MFGGPFGRGGPSPFFADGGGGNPRNGYDDSDFFGGHGPPSREETAEEFQARMKEERAEREKLAKRNAALAKAEKENRDRKREQG